MTKIYHLANGNETWDKDGNCKSVESVYYVTGATGKNEAVQNVISQAEQTMNGIPLKEFRVSEFDSDKNIEITAIYEKSSNSSSDRSADENQPPSFSFSAGGGTKHVTTGTLIKYAFPPGVSEIANPGNLIGWNGDSSPQGFQVTGVDVPTASLRETWEKMMLSSGLTTAWRRKIAGCIGTCNLSTFKGWERGEALLADCSFSGVSGNSDFVRVRFDFIIRLNEKDAEVAGAKLGFVEGWQYVWTMTRPYSTTGSKLQMKPDVGGVYVNKVVSYSDFSVLGL